MTCPRCCGWSGRASVWPGPSGCSVCTPGPLSPTTLSQTATHPCPSRLPSFMSSLTHPSNTQPRPRAGHGDTSQVRGDGREWEGGTLLPEQELLLTTPSGAAASGKTGFQLTALDSPGGSRRGKRRHLAASGGAGPRPGLRTPGAPGRPAPAPQALPLQREHGPASATGPPWGPRRAPSLLGAPGSSPVK